jgi:hypothetical protein
MTALRAPHGGWRHVAAAALVAVAAAFYPAAAAATPAYQGGASAGWGYQEGDGLVANPGTWTSSAKISYSYAWFNESSIRIGTGPTYTVAGSDVGHQIYAAITADDGTPPSLTVNTPTVGPMHYRPPVNTEQPTISGVFVQGSTLAATAGKWESGGASTAPIVIGYAWYRGCSVGPRPDCGNSGSIGDGSSLVLSGDDVGRAISLGVSASYPDGVGGQATSTAWFNDIGRVINSSVKGGDTLSGTVLWTAGAPGAQTITFTVGEASTVVLPADAAGSATLALDTTLMPNGSTNLAVSVSWTNETTTAIPIGSVTIANDPPPPPPAPLKPVIAKPVITPRQPRAGARVIVTFAVTRSDNGRQLARGRMICDPSVKGKVIEHTESFRNGKARLVFTVPRTAAHKLMTVKLTIRLGSQATTRIVTFLIRGGRA